EELRVKESDRIQGMAEGLSTLGIAAEPTADGIRIRGGALTGGVVHSYGDHRIAMSFAVAALRARTPLTICDCANVTTSFPDFVTLARHAGLALQEQESAQ
ncbi:MAG: bifunctional prephenate dehydrogenase/3-phosphoshikimate 1-carboxyvinyltransferase, partial [Candidatus Contendobacter sp.]